MKDISAENRFVAEAVRAKIENDLRKMITDEIVNKYLDKVIDDMVGSFDLESIRMVNPESFMETFQVVVRKG